MNLVLWDVDGTLIRAGPVARRVFAQAVHHVTGCDPGAHTVQMSGKTDPQIADEILAAMGRDPNERAVTVPRIVSRLEAELAACADEVRRDGWVLPGVPEVLARLASHDHVHQSLLTGNLAVNARVKLQALALDGWIDWRVGAFGSDHHDRAELVPIARDRVRRVLGHTPEVVWVVGDTPSDLACARAGGAQCLLVATGRFEAEELRGLDPDAVAEDLSDPKAIAGLLAG